MKVCELIRQLEQWNGGDEVYFAYPAGDYWKSTITSEVSFVQRSELVWSDYHDQYQKPDVDSEPDEHSKKIDVILLI